MVVFFEEKSHSGKFDLFRPFLLFDWAWPELSQANVIIGSLNSPDMISFMISTGSLNSQDMISQVNIYMMDIV